jgi:hypothetical protein
MRVVFPGQKTTKVPFASVYTYCETTLPDGRSAKRPFWYDQQATRGGQRKRQHTAGNAINPRLRVLMTQNVPIPPEQAKEIRRLAHDLSNALEIIVQANYLLNSVAHDESAKQWIQLLDSGVLQAANINRSLREYIVANS